MQIKEVVVNVRNIHNPKNLKLPILDQKIRFLRLYVKSGNNNNKSFKEKSIEILKILILINNIN